MLNHCFFLAYSPQHSTGKSKKLHVGSLIVQHVNFIASAFSVYLNIFRTFRLSFVIGPREFKLIATCLSWTLENFQSWIVQGNKLSAGKC